MNTEYSREKRKTKKEYNFNIMLQYVVFIGVAVNLFGTLFYIRDTLRGKTKPNRVSWFLWTVVPFIATAAALSDGVRLAALPVFIAGFTPLMVFIASFVNPNAYWKLERFDYLCGAFSVLALILWAVTREPDSAILLAILSDTLAAYPTIKKAWQHPETESGATFLGGLLSAITAFFALRTFAFSEYAFPIYLVIQNGLILFAIYRQKLFPRYSLSK